MDERKPTALRRRHEEGAALLVAMLMLVLMGMIGLSSLDTVMRERQVAGYTSKARQALYAADAGIASGLDLVRTTALSTSLAAGTGTSGDCLPNPVGADTLPNGTTFQPDTTAATTSICMIASAEPCSEFDASIEVGTGATYLYTVWDLRMQGETPDGAISRVQATVQRCHAFD